MIIGSGNHTVGWETELAVVIGKAGRNIQVERAYDYVFGYTILNDISERRLNSQMENRSKRELDGFFDWLAGKWFDGFAPSGPWIVTADEIDDPHNLEITLTVNGQRRQQGNTGEMIFRIPEQIAYISSIMTLEPGDHYFHRDASRRRSWRRLHHCTTGMKWFVKSKASENYATK